MPRTGKLVTLAAGAALLAVVGLAAGLPKLPKDRALPRSEDSPGVVTFSHVSHVDAARPDCTTCHPRLFTMGVGPRPAAAVRIRHEDMEQGRLCGACHDGKAAHGLDDCAACHREE
jgi:c(7)-type cytochrome triheme protein